MRVWLLTVIVACADPKPSPPIACDPDACAALGQLCDQDACVDPWRYGSPAWSTCPDEPRATPESLAVKAAGYDARLAALHVSPQMPWTLDVAIAAGVDPETATAADVTAWRSGENDGLWNGLEIAAQAYRFSVTHDPAARAILATLLDGERTRMRITGVPGLLVRQLIPPGVTGLACPTDPAMYVPSPTKTSNVWVRIGSDGCAQTSDGTSFQSSSHCGLDEFAGWCFLDNISQDEYVGHIFGLGAVARVVDDAELHAIATDLLDQIAAHLAQHQMEFVDWDGRATEYGKLFPDAGGDSPGYLAVLGLSVVATAGDTQSFAQLAPSYESRLGEIDVWFGGDGCTSNWNDLSMLAASFHQLIWNDHDADRASLQAVFASSLVAQPRGIANEHDAWYDIMWAAQKPLGPGTDGPAFDAVEDAVCQLRQFPRSNHAVAHDTTALAPESCTGRQTESLAAEPFGVADRCAATYVWWGNPYIRTTCTADPTLVQQPAGYLLPYWMARYYGFITADQ
ncbi:MAG TPA: hypothetical protein VGO00_11310 [Kofleriaceae bacterium]|nr:hypothetical protein [Kofleriaceae bacterium]